MINYTDISVSTAYLQALLKLYCKKSCRIHAAPSSQFIKEESAAQTEVVSLICYLTPSLSGTVSRPVPLSLALWVNPKQSLQSVQRGEGDSQALLQFPNGLRVKDCQLDSARILKFLSRGSWVDSC